MGHILRVKRWWILFQINITVSKKHTILNNAFVYRSSKQAYSRCVCLFTPILQKRKLRPDLGQKSYWRSTPLPWRNSRAPRQNSLRPHPATLARVGLLRHSWPLRLPLWLALYCLFQQIHQHVWTFLMLKRFKMNNRFWSTAVCTLNMERDG